MQEMGQAAALPTPPGTLVFQDLRWQVAVAMMQPASTQAYLSISALMWVVMMFAMMVSSLAPLLWTGAIKNHWLWLLAALAVFLMVIWWSTWHLLATAHPWRAGAMKGLAAGRRM